jgi:hypothetical protein
MDDVDLSPNTTPVKGKGKAAASRGTKRPAASARPDEPDVASDVPGDGGQDITRRESKRPRGRPPRVAVENPSPPGPADARRPAGYVSRGTVRIYVIHNSHYSSLFRICAAPVRSGMSLSAGPKAGEVVQRQPVSCVPTRRGPVCLLLSGQPQYSTY